MNEVVYTIWNYAWGEHWYLYELGEDEGGFYCRCVDADSWETLALGLGSSPTEASTRAFGELLTLAGRKPPAGR